ncbi:hypothetical protein [Thiocapsa marina]|uniref:Uncharacterized protein n=1 Tax=Thiocapsa marina 5811 TaxID=768671 RepID=F9UAM8_9GAMM|nr:hypothetical protein [Thiocapsa marina]EGV18780.1 hypothetical protein ThimaDRAFT_2198 [Thiocapsa marina 5811]
MTDSTTPKTTSAQRQAALRRRASELAYGLDDSEIGKAADSTLFEAIPQAFRLKQSVAIESIAAELVRRLRARSVTVTTPEAPEVTVTIPEPPPVTVTEPQPKRVTVTSQTDQATVGLHGVTVTKRGYPPAVKQMAIGMLDAGASSRDVCEAIQAAHGKAPDVSNLARLARGWRETL